MTSCGHRQLAIVAEASAEPGAALDLATGHIDTIAAGRWWSQVAAPMRPLIVVVQAILVDDRFEVALVEDQHPVQAFSAATPDPALDMRVCPGRLGCAEIPSSMLDEHGGPASPARCRLATISSLKLRR